MQKADKDTIKELKKEYSHKPGSTKGSPYNVDINKFPTGLPIGSNVPRDCDSKIIKAMRDGLMYGKVSLPTFKSNMPMPVHNRFLQLTGKTGFRHDHKTSGELSNALLNEKDTGLYLIFSHGIIFDVVFGNPHKSRELRTVFLRIYENEYKICDSSIGFDRTGKKIQLNLCIDIPAQKSNLNENTVVGVDIGLAIPAVCALNNDPYHREKIGNYEDFTRKRMQIQAQRRSIQKNLKETNGGHGRNAKLKHLQQVELHERAFAKNYNHMVSRKIIEFALKYHAKYINLEDLSGFGNKEKQRFVLRNWSFYELQQMIAYKAAQESIEVRYIDPAYTSQTCSICGKIGNRYSQSGFTCSDPNCKVHTMYAKPIGADFNAARNIAMSENFIDNRKKKVKKKVTSMIEAG